MIASLDVDQAFWVEGFADHLSLGAGNSVNTVESYVRDIRRFAAFAVSRRSRGPGQVTPELVRDFIYHLKDLGLASASIRITQVQNISLVETIMLSLKRDRDEEMLPPVIAQELSIAGRSEPADEFLLQPETAPVASGRLRAPRRWERLLVDAVTAAEHPG